MLLSRKPASEWYEAIVGAGAVTRFDAQVCIVRPLSSADVCGLVRTVADRLVSHYHRPPPAIDDEAVSAWCNRDLALHGLPLIATAAALHAVLALAPTFTLGGGDIVRALVLRERARLNSIAEAAKWPQEKAGARLHALAALRRSLDAGALVRLAQATPKIGLPEPTGSWTRFRSWVGEQDNGIPAPVPDVMAAELLRQTLAEREDAAPSWLMATLGGGDQVEVKRLERLAHDVTTLNSGVSNLIVECLIKAERENPDLALRCQSLFLTRARLFALPLLRLRSGVACWQNPYWATETEQWA